jgi:stage II sporulation protein M
MSRITSLKDNFQNKYNLFFISLYNRNKRLLTLAAAIFFISLAIGVFIGYFLPDLTGHFLTILIQLLGSQIKKVTTLSIFMHNLRAALFVYLGGIIGIIPAVELFFNGLLYGSFVGYFTHGGIISNYGVSNPVDFIIYTLPHGIFEIPGFIIAGTAGFRLTSMVIGVINSMRRKTPVSEHYWKLKDSLALIVIAIILLSIAAIIEANFSVPVGNYITGLNLHHAIVENY